MSNIHNDILSESIREDLEATGEYDCRYHETSYMDGCDSCWDPMIELQDKVEEEIQKRSI